MVAENESESSALWLVGGLFAIVAVVLLVDHFHKPAPKAPDAPPAAQVVAQQAPPPAQAAPAAIADPTAPPTDAGAPPGERPYTGPGGPNFVMPKVAPPKHQSPTDAMRNALKALILAEEAYYSDTGFMHYASRVNQIPYLPVIPEVTVLIREGGTNGYAAIATHAQLPGKLCAIYVGNAAPVAPAKVVGQIGCSDDL